MLSEATQAAPGAAGTAGVAVPLLRLDGFEGPLDLLLELARAQKVDLSRISVLLLVEQYLAVVEAERTIRLELAADWLVMAAWLAWLKSKLLLPQDEAAADEEATLASHLLAERLAELAHVGRVSAWLAARPQLGHDVFARGAAEPLVEIDRSGLVVDMARLLGATMAVMRRSARKSRYRPAPTRLWTVGEALQRLRRLLGDLPPGWQSLDAFLPDGAGVLGGRAERCAAIAGTLIAGLEMARNGHVELRQEQQFGAILLRVCPEEPSDRAPVGEAPMRETPMREAAE